MEDINAIVCNPAYQPLLSVIKGARNGFVYGAKIRFPHALVMTFLFGRGDLRSKLTAIYRATKQHSTNLAKFVAIFKATAIVQKRLNGGVPRDLDTLFAGLVAGYAVFSERNAVNEQMMLYVLSRVVASFIPRQPTPETVALGKPHPPNSTAFSLLATLTWGSAVYLFHSKTRRQTLQSGMVNSMQYLYLDSNYWSSLKTLLWHNNDMRTSFLRMLQPRAITYTEKGAPASVLRVKTLPTLAAPTTGQIRVKFLLSPANPADMNVVEGVYPARAPSVEVDGTAHSLCGTEGVGRVEAVGEGVRSLRPSDWVVMGRSQLGTWRSSALLDAASVTKLPASPALTPVHAATLAINPPTALRMLRDFTRLSRSSWVVQTGATSGVGRAVIQIARAMGVHTVNLVRERRTQQQTDAVKEELKALGATHVLTNEEVVRDSKRVRSLIANWTQSDLALFLNCVGGQETTEVAKTLSEGAHIVTYGAMSKKPLCIPPGLLIFKDIKSVGFWMSKWYAKSSAEDRSAIAGEIVQLIESGSLTEPPHQIVSIGGHQTDQQATQTLRDALAAQANGGKKILFEMKDS
ncbi:hypothetical protein E3P84_03152 [Wallemia ichthyophaga]|nr:hypothetical protein E3P84_03152 [Wallemia ichthyophaga]TIB40112.1 hypothetical protein E3P83_03095 [Wallemia ichthyophaga]